MNLDYQTIMFGIGILGAIFTVYNYFRNPQEDLDKRQAVSEKETEGKASVLAQQLQWEKEASEKKFSEMGLRIDASFTLAQNHIHSVDTKVETLTSIVNKMGNDIVKLTTVIEERIPKK